MAEIKVEEYVRIENGSIDKVTNPNYYMSIYVECEKGIYLLNNIVKHSKQLIDLIEVGDIVEIFDVLHEDVIYIWSEEMLKALKEDIENGIQIRRILTKEQFSANCYKVGGEDE